MTHRFTITADPSGTEIRLEGPHGPVPCNLWAVEAPDALVPGIDLVQRLIASDVALADEVTVLVEHRIIAGLSSREAASLGLPPPAEAVAQISFRGVITRVDFEASLVWARPGGQPILGVARTGAWLTIGGEQRRLADPLYTIAEAVDALNAAPSGEAPERWIALERLQEALPAAAHDGCVEASGLAARMTISVADSFSLDLKGEGAAFRRIALGLDVDAVEPEPVLVDDAINAAIARAAEPACRIAP